MRRRLGLVSPALTCEAECLKQCFPELSGLVALSGGRLRCCPILLCDRVRGGFCDVLVCRSDLLRTTFEYT